MQFVAILVYGRFHGDVKPEVTTRLSSVPEFLPDWEHSQESNASLTDMSTAYRNR